MKSRPFSPAAAKIRIAVGLSMIFLGGCSDAGVVPMFGPLPHGTYRYLGFDTEGNQLVHGWLRIVAQDSNTFKGTWEIVASGTSQEVGPQLGNGILSGEKIGESLWVNLNPDFVDNNVMLVGVYWNETFKGDWMWIGFPGVLRRGVFSAIKS